MKTIWKFEVNDSNCGIFDMPVGATILKIGLQEGNICIWALVDSEAEKEEREFTIFATGMNIDLSKLNYIGSVLQPPFVWHIFEIIKS